MNQPSETPQERKKRYLQYAADAEAFAKRVPDEAVRSHFLYLAKCWREMVAEIEGNGT